MRSNLAFLAGGITGHYRTCAISGLVSGAGAGSHIFSFRNSGGANSYVRMLLQRLRMQMAIVTPFTAAQEIYCAAYVARNFTADDSGGLAMTLTAPNAQLNSIGDAASVATCRVANTGALTPGTVTLDAQPFLLCPGAQLFAASSTTTQAAPFAEEYVLNSDQQYPLNLQSATIYQNVGNSTGPEGIVVKNGIALGAGGVLRFIFEIEWVEYDANTAPGIS